MKALKIIAVVEPDQAARRKLIQRTLVDLKLAAIPSEADRLISRSVYDIDLNNAYVVCADNFSFSDSPATLDRLIRLAAHGLAVVVGVKRIPARYEFICDARYM